MVKKALCCGLNYPKQKYQLSGCINDCLDWEHLLKNTFGFDETRVLIDQNPDGSLCTAPTQIPTRANILAQLGGWLCAGNSPGDCLVFVFAGHGCQVRNSYGQIDEALVPEDWESPDEHGVQPLVMDDELHALFGRLPAGSFLTVVLDCCHSSHMLDVPCCMDSSSRPPKTVQVSERPREVQNRTDEMWSKSLIKHASARPRFVPTISSSGPRQRRTADGSGAHVGQMTLNPGVTAFCFAAARTPEAALDANIKAHQRGVMSFCLLEALAALRNRCTYEMLLEKASAKMDDIREKYMPSMDQHMLLTFCPNSAPSEVVVLDARYAGVAQHRISQRARLAEQNQSDGLMSADGCPTPVREVSTEFVPSPMYNPPDRGQASGGGPSYQPPTGGPPVGSATSPPTNTMPPSDSSHRGPPVNSVGVGTLYLVIHAGYNLLYRDTGCEPYVVARVGHQEHKTPTIHNSAHPVWSEGNRLTFHVGERDVQLELEAMNGYSSLGRTNIDLRSLPPGQWHRRREALRDGASGELEFDVRLEPAQGHGHGGRSPQGHSPHGSSQQSGGQPEQANHNSYSNARARPPSPVRQQAPQDFGRTYSEQCSGAGMGAALDGPCGPPAGFPSGPGAMGGLGPGPCSPQPSMVPPPVYPEGSNMFGTPNLFGAMPNLMSGMFANAGAGGQQPPPLAGGNGVVPSALQMPNRALSGQVPAGLGGPFAAPGGTPTAAGRPGQSLGLPGGQGNFGGGAQPGQPTATIGIDINLNGRTDLVVSGVDLNRDGIPDILQQGGGQAGGGFPGAQAGGGFSATPVPAPLPVSGGAMGQLPQSAMYAPAPAPGPGPMPGGTWEPVSRPGVYSQPPVAMGAQLGHAPSAGAMGGFSCPYPRNSRLY